MSVQLTSLEQELVLMRDRDRIKDALIRKQGEQISDLQSVVQISEEKEALQKQISEEWKEMYEGERKKKKAALVGVALAFVLGLIIN